MISTILSTPFIYMNTMQPCMHEKQQRIRRRKRLHLPSRKHNRKKGLRRKYTTGRYLQKIQDTQDRRHNTGHAVHNKTDDTVQGTQYTTIQTAQYRARSTQRYRRHKGGSHTGAVSFRVRYPLSCITSKKRPIFLKLEILMSRGSSEEGLCVYVHERLEWNL